MYFLSISPYFSLNYQVSTYIVKCYVVLSTTFKRCVRKIYWSVHCTLFSNEYAWMSNEWKILMLNKKMLCGTFHFYLFQLHLKGLYAKCIGQSDIWHGKVDIKKMISNIFVSDQNIDKMAEFFKLRSKSPNLRHFSI